MRLIDAERLEPDAGWDSYYDGYTAYSQMQIDFAPTVVEVVRCRECKHYHAAKDSFGWCENIESPAWDRGVDSHWFCADGERRANDGRDNNAV